MPEKPKPETSAAPAAAAPGGAKAWLPLLITFAAMPLLAYGTMQMFILPKLQQAMTVAAAEPEAGLEDEAPAAGTGRAGAGAASRSTTSVRLEKLVVNVSGTMGTRFLMASITLVGNKPGFKEFVDANRDQFMDLTASTLSSKTIADLERPGARNLLKTELISVINNAMGENLVRDVYIPEMAVQ